MKWKNEMKWKNLDDDDDDDDDDVDMDDMVLLWNGRPKRVY